MNTGEMAARLLLVPPTGTNEMDLHELITQIERDHAMKTRGYVIRVNGYVDPSTWAYHRFVILAIEHRSEPGSPVCTYYIRIDRRAERHLSASRFLRQGGKAKSSDRVRYHV